MSEISVEPYYLQRGTELLLANKTAVDANPQKDVEYPDWSDRYVNEKEGVHDEDGLEDYCENSFSIMLTEPKINLEPIGRHWSGWTFLNKEFISNSNTPKYKAYDSGWIFGGSASAKLDTMIVVYTKSAVDVDTPKNNTTRLYCSELMYQAWRGTCLASSETRDKDLPMGGLKFIAIGLISNRGTYLAIQNAVELRSRSDPSMGEGSVTFSSSDENEDLDIFRMLVGTDNGRPVVRMCADHAKSLGGKQIVKVHVWNNMPYSPGFGGLVFELA
ncbi:hypothetical protein DID88_003659 [Monilinia fructigena]|uniref:Uncharacterized protein n=1 Tax=Monilinia fructigena TaxID=38457 RepID=A0A395ITI4_9HELO|nr:hypothetical protein DID88_003659 [Monilinia fructigena]